MYDNHEKKELIEDFKQEYMEKDTIITLDDDTKYALLDETEIDGTNYFFGVKLDNETENPTTEYEIFEEEIEDGDTYMSALEESDFKQSVLVNFTNNYMYMIGEMMENKENKAE